VSSQPPSEAVPGTGPDRPHGRRLARNTAIFSALTGVSRVAGLVREVVASSYFGTSGAFSAFTLAFQVPNLLRALVADAALSSAFVPVFTELLEQRRKQDAFALAGALFGLILVVLGAVTIVFILIAPFLMPLFTGDTFTPALDELTVGLSQVLFPIVVLLGLNGLVVGVLQAYDHFTIPALAPVIWNLVIIAALVVGHHRATGTDQFYWYAGGVVVGTAVQLGMCFPVLRRVGFHLRISFHWNDPRIRHVLVLMLPVTIGLGVINFDLVINSVLGTLVSDQAPSAIDRAFRLYMLPQGIFSVAIATVLFPTLSRLAARRDRNGLRRSSGTGVRQIALTLIPAAVITAVLATPLTRLVYQRGEFGPESTELVSTALFWFAFSLPFAGANLLLTRTFFSLQRPWIPTRLAVLSLVVNTIVSLALYGPFGIAGIVIGTAVASAAMTALQAQGLRILLRGFEVGRSLRTAGAIVIASVPLGIVAYGVWYGLDQALGRSLIAQVISVGGAIAAGTAVYIGAVLALRVPEAHQIARIVRSRMGAARPS
jgi:putative peptidoglycan lipid II flippase